MPNSYNEDITKTGSESSANGQVKCPKCGATDIVLNSKTGKLRCQFCRAEFEPDIIQDEKDVLSLEGDSISEGAKSIDNDFNGVITLKCQSCGAEVVIDTNEVSQARCHWCRNYLSINEKIPNGSVPDIVLPFKITKEEAQKQIEDFVNKRKFFANPNFKKEFSTNNIMGVYFPYMLVDINSHANFSGQGEHLTGTYFVGNDNAKEVRYNADLYAVEREFDLGIDDLTIESSKDKLDNSNKTKTNNVINAIMPFDTENAVNWQANYLRGFTSEKRDLNPEELNTLVKVQAEDIARFKANESLKFYDRGVAWARETLDIKGTSWKSAYLPVWLYSYQEKKNGMLHYVAVNARTKETMGSVPIYYPKLFLVSGLIELICIIAMLFVDWDYSFLFLLGGFIFFFLYQSKYRNSNARHRHEVETKSTIQNLRQEDNLISHRTDLPNAMMYGANNNQVRGSTNNNKDILKSLNNVVKKNSK